jgi:hypothetical protein
MNRRIFFAVAAISMAALTTSGGLSGRSIAASNGATTQTSNPEKKVKLKKEAELKKRGPAVNPTPKPDPEMVRGRLGGRSNGGDLMRKEPEPTPTPAPKPRPDIDELKERLKEGGMKKKERITIQPKPTPTSKKS